MQRKNRRISALVGCMMALAVPTSRAATPTCDGRPATIVGTDGHDLLRGTPRADVIVGKGGADQILGGAGNDVICGGAGADLLRGGRGNDRLFGGRSGDGLSGDRGDDYLEGGPGHLDDARFRTSPGPVLADLGSGAATGDGTDRLKGIEQLVGSAHDDVLRGSEGPDPGLSGLGGNDLIEGLGGNDILSGGDGDDTIDGGDGSDFLDHRVANRQFEQQVTPVTVDLPNGTVTGQGSDTITGIEGANGTFGPDTLIGDEGANEFTGLMGGDDHVVAGEGDDLVDAGNGSDIVDGGPGHDILGHLDHTTAVTVDLGGGSSQGKGLDMITGFESVLGSRFGDSITGDEGDNALFGADGDDTILGLGGNDLLDGSGGWDSLDGGEGNDVCRRGEVIGVSCETVAGRSYTFASMGYR